MGALAGENYGTIKNCSSAGLVTTQRGRSGGLVGTNFGKTIHSHSTAAITANGAIQIGGLVGENVGTIETSYSASSINASLPEFRDADSHVGGLVGTNIGRIRNAYAACSITINWLANFHQQYSFNSNIGELVAVNGGVIENTYTAPKHTEFLQSQFGGIAQNGHQLGGSIFNSYYTDANFMSYGGTRVTLEALSNPGTFPGWDFTSIWEIHSGAPPTLR